MILGTQPYQQKDLSGIVNLMLSREGLKIRQEELGLAKEELGFRQQQWAEERPKRDAEIKRLEASANVLSGQADLYRLQAELARLEGDIERELRDNRLEAKRQEYIAKQAGDKTKADDAKLRQELIKNAQERLDDMSPDEMFNIVFAGEQLDRARAAYTEALARGAEASAVIELHNAAMHPYNVAAQQLASTIKTLDESGLQHYIDPLIQAQITATAGATPEQQEKGFDLRAKLFEDISKQVDIVKKQREEERIALEEKIERARATAKMTPDTMSEEDKQMFSEGTRPYAFGYFYEHKRYPSDLRIVYLPRGLFGFGAQQIKVMSEEDARSYGNKVYEQYKQSQPFVPTYFSRSAAQPATGAATESLDNILSEIDKLDRTAPPLPSGYIRMYNIKSGQVAHVPADNEEVIRQFTEAGYIERPK